MQYFLGAYSTQTSMEHRVKLSYTKKHKAKLACVTSGASSSSWLQQFLSVLHNFAETGSRAVNPQNPIGLCKSVEVKPYQPTEK